MANASKSGGTGGAVAQVNYTVTFVPTPETAAEAVARAGGRGTNEELQEFVDCARTARRVRAKAVALYIADMAENGYRVESFRPSGAR